MTAQPGCSDCWGEAMDRSYAEGGGRAVDHYERLRALPPEERPWCGTARRIVASWPVWCPGVPADEETTASRVLEPCATRLQHGPHQRGVRVAGAGGAAAARAEVEPSVLELGDAERRMAEAGRAFEDLPPGRSGQVPGVDPFGLAGSA